MALKSMREVCKKTFSPMIDNQQPTLSRFKSLPNALTGLRLALVPLVVLVMWGMGNEGRSLAGAIFLMASLTDWLDGFLARKLNAASDWGRLMDPIADKLLVACVLVMLVAQASAPVIPVVLILSREIFVSALREHYGQQQKIIHVSTLAKWKTGSQMVAVMALLWLPESIMLLGDALLWLAAGLSVWTGYQYARK